MKHKKKEEKQNKNIFDTEKKNHFKKKSLKKAIIFSTIIENPKFNQF